MTGSAATTDRPNARWLTLAVVGAVLSLVLTAIGTFSDLTDNESDNHEVGDYLPVVAIVIVVTALVFLLVVRPATAANAALRALIVGIVAFLSVAVFWAGLPAVLAAAAVSLALVDREGNGRFSGRSVAALILSGIAVAGAIVLAIAG